MKTKYLYIYLFLFIGLKTYSQKTAELNFDFNSKKMNYYYYTKYNYANSFYLIINDTESKEKIIECIKKNKKNKSKLFFFKIPAEFNNQEDKEKLVLEFITNVLKMKLIDSKMAIISDFDYFKLYNETRKGNNNHYKNTYLNPINSLIILNNNETVCEKIN